MSAVVSLRIVSMLAVVLLAATSAFGQFGSLSGPVLGYVVDGKTSAVRPVKGILGSATLGEVLDTGVAPSSAAALGPGHAIVSTSTGIELLALSTDASRITRASIPGASANPSRVAISRQATSAAFYYSASQQIQIVTGLPKEPRYLGAVQTDGPVTQMAVNDDGMLLIYVVGKADEESLYAWTDTTGSPRFLTTTASASGIAITQSGDAIVTDRGTNEVFAIWDAAGGAVRRLLADAHDGVSDPKAVAVSSGNRIYVANAGSAAAMILDGNGRYLKSQSCNCNVSGLVPLRDSVFRLTDRIDQTIFLLDASSPEERIVFVPPPLE
jgi:hypothetical protein